MLPNLVIQNAFKNLTNNGQEANWTIVCCIGQITLLWNRNYNGLLPASWKGSCFQAEIEDLGKDGRQFRSAMTKNSNWNTIGTACLRRIKLKNNLLHTFGTDKGQGKWMLSTRRKSWKLDTCVTDRRIGSKLITKMLSFGVWWNRNAAIDIDKSWGGFELVENAVTVFLLRPEFGLSPKISELGPNARNLVSWPEKYCSRPENL